jgi:Rad3-related DNA helicase
MIYDFLRGTAPTEPPEVVQNDATIVAGDAPVDEPPQVRLQEGPPVCLVFSDSIRAQLPFPAIWSIEGDKFWEWAPRLLAILDKSCQSVVSRFTDLAAAPGHTVVTCSLSGCFALLIRSEVPFVPAAKSRNLRSFFPYKTPRDGQLEYAQEIVDAFDAGFTDVILQGATGVGKSVVAITVARYMLNRGKHSIENGFVATPLKTLQNQYANDSAFVDHLAVVKGRNAYRCDVSGTTSPACSHLGKKARDKMRMECKCEDRCLYYRAIRTAQEHDLVLHNLASLIFQSAPLGHYFDKRDLLILDEAHTAENNLLDMYSVTFNMKTLEKFKVGFGMPTWGADGRTEPKFEDMLTWLSSLKTRLTSYLIQHVDEMKEIEEKGLQNRLQNIEKCLKEPTQWVIDNKPDEVTLKPLDVSTLAQIVWGKAKMRLWMSATILGKDNFALSMGLNPKKCHYIEAPSTFPVKNRPVYGMECFGIGSLARSHLDNNLPKLIDAMDRIIDNYPDEKGLVHTHTYKIMHALINNSRHRHRMVFHDATNRENVLGDFLRSPDPDILVSPSMVEGIDLKDDLARFQILCKVPWPYLGDPQIAALKDRREGWYLWKTSLDIVQACGRIVRHNADWGDTYVLDPDFRRWFRSARDILPDYFARTVKFVKEF